MEAARRSQGKGIEEQLKCADCDVSSFSPAEQW
jgi:hypothetical protein